MPPARLLAALLLATLTLPVAAFELDAGSRDYDQEHLALDLFLDLDRGEVVGTARLSLAPLADRFRILRLHSEDTEVRAVSVSISGEPPRPAARFRSGEGLLEIELDREYARGGALSVEIDYLARPTAGLYFFRPTSAHPMIPLQVWSQGEGTDNRHWFPCYDLPDDRLSSEVSVVVPEGLEVFSNGVRSEPAPGPAPGTRRWHYRFDDPHVTYLVTLVAGTFETVSQKAGEVELLYHVPPGRKGEVARAFGNTPDMLLFYGDVTGRAYPWPVYRQIVVWDFMYGGMENTTATTLNLRALHDERSHGDYRADYLVAHELAHMWFGDLVTCRTMDHMWLNEGFATYFTDLWVEHHFGRSDFLVRRRSDATSWVGGSTPESRAGMAKKGRTIPVEMPSFNYTKGACVLHLLRHALGDDLFRRGIRLYVERAALKSVETEVFQAAMEEASGQDLDWLFDPWVYGSGYPEFEVSWEWRAAASQAAVRVKQTQELEKHRDLFRVPVVLAFTWAGAGSEPPRTERRTVWIEKAEHEYVFELPGLPDVVRFDEGNAIPKKLRFEKGVPELSRQLALDPDLTGRLDSAEALAALGAAGAEALARALPLEAEPSVRRAICEALAKTGGEKARKALVVALERDASSEVRRVAATSLASFEGDDVEEILRRAIEEDASDFVVGSAAESLAKVAKAEARDALHGLLERSSYSDVVRRGALAGLLSVGDAADLPQFLRFTSYEWGAGAQHELARAALEGAVKLAGADHPDVRARLVERLGDPYFRTRELAARLLAENGRLEAVGALLDAIRAERRRDVRSNLDGSLRKLAETAAARDADPLAGRGEKEIARLLEKAKAGYEESRREARTRKRWLDLLEAAEGKE